MKDEWVKYFLSIARVVSSKSKDPSTQVGAVIVSPDHEVVSTGYNDFPRGVRDSLTHYAHRRVRPDKYLWTEHAERNAIYAAAKRGTPLAGCVMVVSGGLAPCADCARAIIQAGMFGVICTVAARIDAWEKSSNAAAVMFAEAGVSLRIIYSEETPHA